MSIVNDAAQRAAWLASAGRLLLAIDDLQTEITIALHGQVSYTAMIALVEADADLAATAALIKLASSKIARIQ